MFAPTPSALIKFLRLKRYQYEVTFSLYVLTPTEKLIFNTFIFVLFSFFVLYTARAVSSLIDVFQSMFAEYYAAHQTTALVLGSIYEPTAAIVGPTSRTA